MSLYTLKQLLNDCSTRMTRTKCAADKKRETLEDVWRAFNDWIESRFTQGKGVHVATFATISWETCTNARNVRKLRPVFFLSDTFLKTYGLTQKRGPPLPSAAALASLEDINFTKIAIKFSHNLTKDLVFSGIRDMLQKLGQVAGSGAPVSIAFNFGRLIAKNRCVSVLFDPLQFPRALEDQITRSMLGSPPSTLGNLEDFDIPPEDVVDYNDTFPPIADASKTRPNVRFPTDGQEALPTSRSNPDNVIPLDVSIEEELQMYDALHSPAPGAGSNESEAKHRVMESAFKRHISNLAGDVDREAKYAFDLQLQQKRDLESVALEHKMRRMCAEDLQRHLRVQMQQRDRVAASEKHERRSIDPSASSFYSESEQTRLGFDDQKYLQRVKEELKHQLQDQIYHKEQERMNSRQKHLQDDKLFLRRLRSEMEAIEHKQAHDREELRKALTGSWNRDSGIKKFVEARKKQKATEQIHHEGIAVSPGRRDHHPTLPQPMTPRLDSYSARAQDSPRAEAKQQQEDDFSVGFDIRSVCE